MPRQIPSIAYSGLIVVLTLAAIYGSKALLGRPDLLVLPSLPIFWILLVMLSHWQKGFNPLDILTKPRDKSVEKSLLGLVTPDFHDDIELSRWKSPAGVYILYFLTVWILYLLIIAFSYYFSIFKLDVFKSINNINIFVNMNLLDKFVIASYISSLLISFVFAIIQIKYHLIYRKISSYYIDSINKNSIFYACLLIVLSISSVMLFIYFSLNWNYSVIIDNYNSDFSIIIGTFHNWIFLSILSNTYLPFLLSSVVQMKEGVAQ